MHSKRISLYFTLACLVFVLAGCVSGGKFDEGTIDYSVTYPNVDAADFMSSFLPKDLKLVFKGNIQKLEMIAGMGVFKSSYIIDSQNKTVAQSLKLMSNKVTTFIDKDAQHHFTKVYTEAKIEFVEGSKTIAGYECKKAIATFPNSNRKAVELYYTEDIKIKESNWYNPYKNVPGTLLSFEMELYSMLLKIEATSVNLNQIEVVEFTVPTEYKVISSEAMDKEVQSVFDAFKN